MPYQLAQTQWCTFNGQMRTLFMYYGVAANQYIKDYQQLRLLQRYADTPFIKYLMTVDDQTQPNEVSGQGIYTLIKGSSTILPESSSDPGTHWYNGMVFKGGNFATFTQMITQTNDYLVRFWINKAVADVRFFSFQRKRVDTSQVITFQHIPKIATQQYVLQICILEFCYMHPTPMNTKLWYLVAVSIYGSPFQQFAFDAFINMNLLAVV